MCKNTIENPISREQLIAGKGDLASQLCMETIVETSARFTLHQREGMEETDSC